MNIIVDVGEKIVLTDKNTLSINNILRRVRF
jgi:hypothetical protein